MLIHQVCNGFFVQSLPEIKGCFARFLWYIFSLLLPFSRPQDGDLSWVCVWLSQCAHADEEVGRESLVRVTLSTIIQFYNFIFDYEYVNHQSSCNCHQTRPTICRSSHQAFGWVLTFHLTLSCDFDSHFYCGFQDLWSLTSLNIKNGYWTPSRTFSTALEQCRCVLVLLAPKIQICFHEEALMTVNLRTRQALQR